MKLSPDETVFWEYGFITINLTIVTTWLIILVLAIAAKLITRKLKADIRISHWQSILEMLVVGINKQIEEIGLKNPKFYIDFLGTLFLFIVVSNILIILPWYQPPTASLSTTVALAICVFLAVPYFGIAKTGLWGYLKTYINPTFIMLPLNLISEITRTFALAVRLFGNMMSGGLIIAILLSISPFIFPIVMKAIGLLTGMVQAYIFGILATVYIAAAVQNAKPKDEKIQVKTNNKNV